MIECKVGKDCGVKVMATGSTKDLANDVLCIMNAIHNSIKERDPNDADMFRVLVGFRFVDEEFWDLHPNGIAVSTAVPKNDEPEVE